jgi:hypothetical protein
MPESESNSNRVAHSRIDDGSRMRFWTDKWLDGRSISQLAPSLSRAVPKGTRKSRLVRDAISQASWIQDFVSVQALREYVHLWVRIQSVHLQERIPDRFLWRWTSDQKYSTSSASVHGPQIRSTQPHLPITPSTLAKVEFQECCEKLGRLRLASSYYGLPY